MTSPIDLVSAETAPFTAGPEHQMLATFAGSWRGPTQLWLDPSEPPEESQTELLAELVLGGRWLRLSWRGTALAKPHAGQMLIGYHSDARNYELAWIDSFHTASSIMLFTGPAAPGSVDVLGSYSAGGQRWGWRNRLSLASRDELLFEAFNIPSDGVEIPAIASRLRKV
jgi:uncharacterized protein DUF1579